MPDRKSPLDQALDLLVYAPLGLALTAKEELPRLVEKGRQQVSGRVTVARMIGQFAVTAGRKEAEKAAGRLAEQAVGTAARLGALSGTGSVPTSGTVAGAAPAARPATPHAAPPPATPSTRAAGANGSSTNGGGSARADELAIPGYDSLSASQVVQRLAGLSPAELDAVRTYEEATRSRRTILAKVAQLQHERS
jgi:hypothetical protein